ncbi:MAG: 50S ribosomal protein L32e [Candidatus Heimdallarchaeota archaeon]|nr:50S ribosomal protein L32e [Candidatus Heimdallarchaeota archaeon]
MKNARLKKIRSNLKTKRPKFRRIESWRYIRVKERWRKPRGIDTKAKEKKAGWPISPKIGFRSPKRVRHQSSSGKEEIIVNSPTDLTLMDSKNQVARIAATVGRKKREQIIMEAELLNINVLNPIVAKIDLGDLEEELELDEDMLEDIAIEDLDLEEDSEESDEK